MTKFLDILVISGLVIFLFYYLFTSVFPSIGGYLSVL